LKKGGLQGKKKKSVQGSVLTSEGISTWWGKEKLNRTKNIRERKSRGKKKWKRKTMKKLYSKNTKREVGRGFAWS